MNNLLVGFIPILPLLVFLILLFGRRRFTLKTSGWISIIGTGMSFMLTLPLLWYGNVFHIQVPWFEIEGTVIQFGFTLYTLNTIMLVIVSFISLLVQIYSLGYMKEDQRVATFYAYLSLFTFSMLGLVMSSNLLQLYIFWELVGVCSFLLIGFWYFKPTAREAARKAFIVTRIGDVGLFIAICLIFWQVGSFEITDLYTAVSNGAISPGMITWIAILTFLGAVGKSGQFPLHTWLPDAMEGPTPVSALIHAATMVAAGVYLVASLFFLFEASEIAMNVVANTGAFTAIFAATIALTQFDIKRILAYSTVSQLGYMMFALGSSGLVAGVFHLMTHAFFKALLFLLAGAIIYTLHHEQDIRKMNGLWHTHKGLGVLFLIGCLSIAGIPPFSGFFSKEEILLAAYADGRMSIFWIGVIASFLTTLYMFRLFFQVFMGDKQTKKSTLPVPTVMYIPMVLLALISSLIGFTFDGKKWGAWLTDNWVLQLNHQVTMPIWIPIVVTSLSLVAIGLAYVWYGRKKGLSEQRQGWFARMQHIVYRKYYVDEFYQFVILMPLKGLSWFLNGFDRFIVGGLVYLTSLKMLTLGSLGSRLQNGQAQRYLLISVMGCVCILM
ncbi:NADH-quinone oxidoreductase subunit L [Hazenella sp. IB182357]|uniref:NADH-quinone oxidoreductase subunit L n=1 Tax=Polycladospora coralii TaxID=2771432 RepID=A0A926RSZ5_9BACL|nr:NADH-quinone oxidoreductase subunit L [Polycladospora coralii]MBD1372150.1 NADH-quinone oxidoreductase subunit L [Polycladospora coralii]